MPTMHFVKRKDARRLGIQLLLSRLLDDNKQEDTHDVSSVKFEGCEMIYIFLHGILRP